MKKIILALTMVAFTVAIQAGEGKTCSNDKAACEGKDKAACASKADSGCCAKATMAQGTCHSGSGVAGKATCPMAQAAKKRSLMSPKAAGELALN